MSVLEWDANPETGFAYPRSVENDTNHSNHSSGDILDGVRAHCACGYEWKLRGVFSIEAIRENVGLSDKLFRFRIPAGVEVISG